MSGKAKYGVLGCGKHALSAHAIPGKDLAELELAAVYDISESQLIKFENSYGNELKKFTDKNKFLHSGISAVLIGTPDEFHYQDMVSVIDAGLHAFVEKPLCVNSEELKGLEKVLQTASNKGLILSSCHPRRYDSPFIWLKENLPEFINDMGRPLEFRFDFSYHKPSKAWKQTRGLLLDHANHEIDLMHYLFGHEKLEAIKLADSFDNYKVIGNRADGLKFSFAGTRRLESRKYLEWASIRFEKGDILLDSTHGLARVNYHDKGLIDEIKVKATDPILRGMATMKNFARVINGTEKCYLSADDLFANTAMSVMLTENNRWRYKW